MKAAVLLALLLAHSAATFAEDGPAPDFQVEVNPNLYPAKKFTDKNLKTGEIPSRMKRPDALPEKTEREAAFSRVPGLAAEIAAMDELDRDILFVRSKNRTLAELKNFYPKISETKLARLKKESSK